eukprot:961837-Alexandrium_andersonii.AAC.1
MGVPASPPSALGRPALQRPPRPAGALPAGRRTSRPGLRHRRLGHRPTCPPARRAGARLPRVATRCSALQPSRPLVRRSRRPL